MKKILAITTAVGLIVLLGFVNSLAQTGSASTLLVSDTTPPVNDTQLESQTSGGSISAAAAREIAQAKFPNKTIDTTEVGTENDEEVYTIIFIDNSTVDIRTSDGLIVRTSDEVPVDS